MIHVTQILPSPEQRYTRARTSWERIPFKRHYSEHNRILDMISEAFEHYPSEQTLIFTNADSVLATDTVDIVSRGLSIASMVYSHRGNFWRPLRHPLCNSDIVKRSVSCVGVDLLGVNRWKWYAIRQEAPRLLLGWRGWDWWVRAVGNDLSSLLGVTVRLVAHEVHGTPRWMREPESEGNLWNAGELDRVGVKMGEL